MQSSPRSDVESGPTARFRRLTFTAAGLGCFALIVTIFVWLMYGSWADTGRSATLSSANLAATLAQDVERNVELLDESLKAAARNWADPRVQDLPKDLRDAVIFDASSTAPGFGNVVVLDRTGSVLASQQAVAGLGSVASSRDYFVVHVGNPDVGLFISRPFVSAISREWVIALSRRINNPGGSFAGVVVGTIKLSYLDKLLATVDLGPNGLAALLRLDGTIVAQVPNTAGTERRNLHVDPDRFDLLRVDRAGSIEGPSAFDGQERISSFRRIGRLPLIQVVELGSAAVFAEWWRKTIGLGVVILCLGAGSLSLFLMLNTELIRRAKAEAELSRIARTDSLTALANRLAFDAIFDQYRRQAIRDNTHLSLLMIDADHFKLYNDSMGHPAGDDVLRLLAGCIRANVHRPEDLPCRIGGEEFAVLLPKTDGAGAAIVAEAIRSAVETLACAHLAAPLGILTVSIGVASLRSRHGHLSDHLVEQADKALYQAKHDGRNRVRLADMEPFRQVA